MLAPCKALGTWHGWARGEREGYGEPCDVTSLSLSLMACVSGRSSRSRTQLDFGLVVKEEPAARRFDEVRRGLHRSTGCSFGVEVSPHRFAVTPFATRRPWKITLRSRAVPSVRLSRDCRCRRSRRPAGFDAILRGDQKTAVPPHVVLLRRLFGRLLGSLLGRSFFSLPFGPGRGLRAASFFWRHRSKRHQSAAAAQAARKRFSANTEQVPERGSQIRAAEDTRRTKRSPGSRRPGPPPTG